MRDSATAGVRQSFGRFMRRFGPGFVTAALVLGPGSVVSASRAGAECGYRLLWVLATASVLMAAFTAMGARLGCALESSPLQYLAGRGLRPLAVLTGLASFLVTAGFQFGNNLGVATAMHGLAGGPEWLWAAGFTGIAVVFLFGARRLYLWLERCMLLLVVIMIVSFLANLLWARVDIPKAFAGLVPSLQSTDEVVVRAMLATTFSVVAAFYQAYLVRAKGWGRSELNQAVWDAWSGIAVLGAISATILLGAAATLHGAGRDFTTVAQLADQLKGTLGPAANFVFCCGLAAASFSSFLVNALIGGHLLADGFGQEARIDSPSTKWCAFGVMIVGCGVAIATFLFGRGNTTSLLIAQASTLLAAPLCAILLFILTSRRAVMGDLVNSRGAVAVGLVGLGMLLWLNALTLVRLLGARI